MRQQRARAFIRTEALHDCLIGLKVPNQFSEPYCFRGNGKRHSATSATRRDRDAVGGQFLNDLVQVVTREVAKLARQQFDTHACAGRSAGQQHKHAQRKIGGCEQAHGEPHNWY
jgi:hypothetical protein